MGRLQQALTGDEANGGTNPDGPYKQTYEYDVWNHTRSRINRLWSRDLGFVNRNYVNNRFVATPFEFQWQYDADGNLTRDDIGERTYNAAGQQATGPIYVMNTPSSAHLTYDGDGNPVRHQEAGNNTFYFIRSTILKGEIIVEFCATCPVQGSGMTSNSYIYANGQRMIISYGAVGAGGFVFTDFLFEYKDPITQNRRDNKFNYLEVDPLGSEVGVIDPGPEGTVDVHEPRTFGNAEDPSDGCVLDGVTIPCSEVRSQMEIDAVRMEWQEVNPNGTLTRNSADLESLGLGLFGVWLPDDARGNDVTKDYYLFNFYYPQKSDCAIFVETLVPQINLLSQTNEGRAMAKWAGYELANAAAKNRDKVPTGFQEQYVKGGQNGYAMVHIALMAGATLVGKNLVDPYLGTRGRDTGDYLVYRQYAEDRNQLEDGLNRRRMGLTTIGKDGHPDAAIKGASYPPDYDLNKYIDEKFAELAGDDAGVIVGHTLQDMFAGKKLRDKARAVVFQLLCNW